MAITKIPSASGLSDQQFIQVTGPDGIVSGYQYDAQTRSLYIKESQLTVSGNHGVSHIGEDLVPDATTDTPGLMSPDDKAKLDAILGTRIGIIGFQGSGFPDDGGWMQGDLLLATGSEFISIERIGNVIRFTVDNPIPLNCSTEACAQLFWVQDETEVSAIRPPSCAGVMPGVDVYGEMKIYLLPESTLIDPANPSVKLAAKGNYPSLVFKRYDDSLTPDKGELELSLQRDPNNLTQTIVGWAMTPGAGQFAECVWWLGKDTDGALIRFDLKADTEPGMLGALLYKGHLITKQMGVIVDYSSTILSTNNYICKFWDTLGSESVGDEFTAKNIWKYDDIDAVPVNVLDKTINLLEIGELVDIWYFKIGESNGEPQLRYFINKKPNLLPEDYWSHVGYVKFGDVLTARSELSASSSNDTDKSSYVSVSSERTFERNMWGITNFEVPVIAFEDADTGGVTDPIILNNEHKAIIDTSLPGLIVEQSSGDDPFSERPVVLWNRIPTNSHLIQMQIGRPSIEGYPLDILLQSPIDNFDNAYMSVVATGSFVNSDDHYILVKGVNFRDLPNRGVIRIISSGSKNQIYKYFAKALFPTADSDALALVSDTAYSGDVGDIVELLHEEYNGPCVRMMYSTVGDVQQIQFLVGTLDMSVAYQEDDTDDADDYVRGLSDGYAVSGIYTQDDVYPGDDTQPDTNVSGWALYDGGTVAGTEYWNDIEIMCRDSQVWIWWNGLLIPPSTSLSEALSSPVEISTPYFTIDQSDSYGKFGVRMWPGVKLRKISVSAKSRPKNEFHLGQLEIGR